MRFLEEHELPEWERERRAQIVQMIEYLKGEIERHYAKAQPEMERMVQRGEYDRAQAYRGRLLEETEIIRREIARYANLLPPFMMCRKDEILERVQPGDGQ
jgi:hypothetical protein